MTKTNSLFLVAILAATLTACGTTNINKEGSTGSVVGLAEPTPTVLLSEQKLSTNFKRQGAKVEWKDGKVQSIEMTGYASVIGNSAHQQDAAFDVAEMDAKARLSHFLKEVVVSKRATAMMTKNVEKAQDNIKHSLATGSPIPPVVSIDADEVSADDVNKTTAQQPAPDADPNDNTASRQSAYAMTQSVKTSITVNSQAILSGVYLKDSEVMSNGKTVQVTIRWDAKSGASSAQLRRVFSAR